LRGRWGDCGSSKKRAKVRRGPRIGLRFSGGDNGDPEMSSVAFTFDSGWSIWEKVVFEEQGEQPGICVKRVQLGPGLKGGLFYGPDLHRKRTTLKLREMDFFTQNAIRAVAKIQRRGGFGGFCKAEETTKKRKANLMLPARQKTLQYTKTGPNPYA